MLTTADKWKVWAGVASDDRQFDAFLDLVVPEVDDAIRTELNRPVIEQQTGLVEYLEGNGREKISLLHNPVQEIESLYQDNTGYWGQGTDAFTGDALIEGKDYALERDDPLTDWSLTGTLVRINDVWESRIVRTPGYLASSRKHGAGNFKVTYTAGLTADSNPPPALELAANEVISQIKLSRKFGFPVTSEGLSEYHYSLGLLMHQIFQTGTVAAILSKYRRIAI